jgi:hypothetical protein
LTDTTTGPRDEYVLLAAVVYVHDNPNAPRSLIEVHAPDCVRVTADKDARIIRRATGDPVAAAPPLAATGWQAFADVMTGGSVAHAMRERGEDPRFVLDADGRTALWFFGHYVGRCVRGLDKRCFRPEWTDGADGLGAGTY